MLAETFTYVENGEAVQTGIQRGSRYNGKKYGAESPDARYTKDGLYPEIGEESPCDHATQTISGPVFVIDEENKQSVKTWTVKDKTTSALESDARRAQNRVEVAEARVHLAEEHSQPETVGELRQRVEWLEKIILATN